jgi:hypothetical protein
MLSPLYVHTFAAGADAAQPAIVVSRIPAEQQITDTFAARAFWNQLGRARRAASSDPAVAAQLLSAWMSHNG